MSIPKLFKRAILAASVVAAATASAQDIKLGYNGDLSASPSAQSGQAAVLGMEAAIADINAAGGVLGRERRHPGHHPLRHRRAAERLGALLDHQVGAGRRRGVEGGRPCAAGLA